MIFAYQLIFCLTSALNLTIGTLPILEELIFRQQTDRQIFFSYAEFDKVREYLDGFENLFRVGRNGPHCYNNMDQSMVTAIIAVGNIIDGKTDKADVWEVNTEKGYHEIDEGNNTGNESKR